MGLGPYGELIQQTGYLPLTGYTGHIQTEPTGLIYMRGRFYSPAWHRFMNSDQGVDPNSINQFAYVSGNPLAGTDPSGWTIVFGGKSTLDQIEAYERAVEYARNNSPRAAELIKSLEEDEREIQVDFNNNNVDRFTDALGTVDDIDTVDWDPDSGLQTTDGGTQSPTLGLMHEFGHAENYFTKESEADYLGGEENRNLIRNENPIAGELGESTREDYGDVRGTTQTGDVTSPAKDGTRDPISHQIY